MKMSETTVRRGLYGVFAGGLLGGIASAAILMPSANAAPDQCSASGMATTQSSVSLSMSTYLQTHPETNQALTDIAKQSPTMADASYRTYFAANPKVADESQGDSAARHRTVGAVQHPGVAERSHRCTGVDLIVECH